MPIILETKGKVGIVRINNIQTLNALSCQILHDLDAIIKKLCDEDGIRVIIITGTGKSFVAGADIFSMSKMNTCEAEWFAMLGSSIFRRIETADKVFIAAVNGYALGGGCELALACDLRVASEKSKFGLPEVTLGVFPGFSGIRRMMDVVGETKTKELVFTGAMISAEEAYNMNLVNKVVSPESLEHEAMTLAENIASNSFNAIIQAKRAISFLTESAENVIKHHSALFAECFSHPDQKEGMNAFLEKRKPLFK